MPGTPVVNTVVMYTTDKMMTFCGTLLIQYMYAFVFVCVYIYIYIYNIYIFIILCACVCA